MKNNRSVNNRIVTAIGLCLLATSFLINLRIAAEARFGIETAPETVYENSSFFVIINIDGLSTGEMVKSVDLSLPAEIVQLGVSSRSSSERSGTEIEFRLQSGLAGEFKLGDAKAIVVSSEGAEQEFPLPAFVVTVVPYTLFGLKTNILIIVVLCFAIGFAGCTFAFIWTRKKKRGKGCSVDKNGKSLYSLDETLKALRMERSDGDNLAFFRRVRDFAEGNGDGGEKLDIAELEKLIENIGYAGMTPQPEDFDRYLRFIERREKKQQGHNDDEK